MLLHGRAEGHCFPARQQEGPTSVSAAPGAAPLKLEVSSPGESKAGWECPFGHCYGHCCSLPILYPLLTVNYISISHGLNNPVFKMGTMFPSAGARTVCWGEGQVWLPTCPQAVHPASRGRSCERLQVACSSSVQAGGPQQVFLSHSAFSPLKEEKSPQGGRQNKQLLGYQYSRTPPAI